MSKIERRYARLIRLYPAAHRATRGPEMLDALLQSPFSLREVRALLLGALRAHAARQDVSPRQDLLTAFRTAAMMLLAAGVVSRAVYVVRPFLSSAETAGNLAVAALGLAALACALRGRYLLSALGALVTLVASAFWPVLDIALWGLWGYPLAILLLIPLRWFRPGRASGVLKYLPLLPVVLVLGDLLYSEVFPAVSGILRGGVYVGVVMAALLWLAVDERVSMAVGLYFLDTLFVGLVYLADGWTSVSALVLRLVVIGVPPVVLLAAAAGRNRYQVTP